MDKVILLIDDTKASTAGLKQIEESLKRKRINSITKYINPTDRCYWDGDKDPVLEKVMEGIVTQLEDLNIDLIIVDNFYGDSKFTGLDIIWKLREIAKFKSTPIFLTSGNRDKIVGEIFGNVAKDNSQKVKELAKLINYKIEGFLDKDYHSLAIQFLMESRVDKILVGKLREFESKNIVVNTFSGRHSKSSIGQIANIIENREIGSTAIISEMIDLSLAHYINIENELS